MAMMVPLPSHEGFFCRNASAPVSTLGCRDTVGKAAEDGVGPDMDMDEEEETSTEAVEKGEVKLAL